jgi:hypothetical protein
MSKKREFSAEQIELIKKDFACTFFRQLNKKMKVGETVSIEITKCDDDATDNGELHVKWIPKITNDAIPQPAVQTTSSCVDLDRYLLWDLKDLIIEARSVSESIKEWKAKTAALIEEEKKKAEELKKKEKEEVKETKGKAKKTVSAPTLTDAIDSGEEMGGGENATETVTDKAPVNNDIPPAPIDTEEQW